MQSENTSYNYASSQTEPYSTKYSPMFISLTPLFIVVGTVGNLLILLVMPRSCVKTPATTRVYYCWIAFFDMLTIVSKDVFFSFLEMGIAFAYNDSPPAFFLIFSNSSACCQIIAYIYGIAELTANNTIVALAIERIIIMFLPFRAKQLTGVRKANIGLTFLLIFATVIALVVFYSVRSFGLAAYSKVNLCLAGNPDYPFAAQVFVVAYMLVYVIPTFSGTVLASVALLKLKSIQSKSRQLTRRTDDDVGSKELKSTVVMIATVVTNNAIFIPIGVCYCAVVAVQTSNPTNFALQLQMLIVWLQMYPFAIIPHSCQIFIYCSQIPGFLQGIASLCKKN